MKIIAIQSLIKCANMIEPLIRQVIGAELIEHARHRFYLNFPSRTICGRSIAQ
ncbi:hypothetical protein HAV22_21490 [Massilia sp. TW-1]|uniref:Uncharacterized protein n=1 Tax=Telluria antibiotica TaxID=2717319 RepID=A0ABX0PFZ8_9BURK|nr:hypothetical protein [Telluria antibiotica]